MKAGVLLFLHFHLRSKCARRMQLGSRTVLLLTEAATRSCMLSALVLVQSTTDTHTALPLVTHITRSFKQMPSVSGREKFWKQCPEDVFFLYIIRSNGMLVMKEEIEIDPSWNISPCHLVTNLARLASWWGQLSDLAGNCPIPALLHMPPTLPLLFSPLLD